MSPFSILLLSSMYDSTLHRKGAKSNARHSSARGGRSACASTRPFRAQCQRMGRECSPRRTSPPNALRAFFAEKRKKETACRKTSGSGDTGAKNLIRKIRCRKIKNGGIRQKMNEPSESIFKLHKTKKRDARKSVSFVLALTYLTGPSPVEYCRRD